MFTTFDRYLYFRFLSSFVALFIASVGLFTVVDGFMNLDDFQSKGDGTGGLLLTMARHYLLQSSMLLDLLGPTACVLAVLTTLALVLKHGELHPLLAAGVSTYRLAVPFVCGVLTVNVVMAFNQEWVIPRIAQELQGNRGDGAEGTQEIEPQIDPRTRISVAAASLNFSERILLKPEFMLPTPSLVDEPRLVLAESAKFYSARGRAPSGWLLQKPQPAFESLRLTDEGRKLLLPQSKTGDLFIASTVTPDQLSNPGGSYRYLATIDLLQRIQLPAGSLSQALPYVMNLHARLTRPILTLIGVFLVIPLIARKERMSLVQNVAVCMAALGLVYGLTIAGTMLGQMAVMKPALAAWFPLAIGGTWCAWLTGSVRT